MKNKRKIAERAKRQSCMNKQTCGTTSTKEQTVLGNRDRRNASKKFYTKTAPFVYGGNLLGVGKIFHREGQLWIFPGGGQKGFSRVCQLW